jgi:hypothetical protein
LSFQSQLCRQDGARGLWSADVRTLRALFPARATLWTLLAHAYAVSRRWLQGGEEVALPTERHARKREY